MSAVTGGCTGTCCAAFTLSKSRAEIWVNQDVEDGLDLLAMVVPIGDKEAAERLTRAAGWPIEASAERDWYRCVHWDEETHLCTNYENRPGVCRWYPYGRECDYGCGCDCDRAPRVWEGDYA